jgi:hypothetical protein
MAHLGLAAAIMVALASLSILAWGAADTRRQLRQRDSISAAPNPASTQFEPSSGAQLAARAELAGTAQLAQKNRQWAQESER